MPDEMPATPSTAPASPIKAVIDRSHKGEAAPSVGFADPQDKQVTIASFKGKPVLVNLWATWCAPCVAEMPTLDKLAAARAGKLTVLTVSQDMDGQSKVLPFFEKGGYKTIKPYIDAQNGLGIAYKANLPTTILYDASGHEVWRASGGMDWTGKDAEALLGEVG
ncbi:MAG: TlpA family protein disulfide reductase [Sphingomonas sp.]|uniref:TlpA family protein disulfide reductase n=1 Tax=Sphingomonas sp. TaxID=28214 RepID=UPI003F32F58D